MANATRRQLWRMAKMLFRQGLKTILRIFKPPHQVEPHSQP